jgi:polysaccharide biosynthesis protein PslH
MRSVVVAKFVPWPPNSGDKRRTLGLVRALRRHGEVTLCAFETSDDDAAPLRAEGIDVRSVPLDRGVRSLVEGLVVGRSLTAARFWDRRLATVVAQAVDEGADVLIVGHVQLMPYAPRDRTGTFVVDMQNIESSLARRIAASSAGLRRLAWTAEAWAIRRLERRSRKADITSVVSELDRSTLAGIVDHPNVVVVPNAWDEPEPLQPAADPVVSFVALLSWSPNVDAAVWFCEQVWPRVLAELPEARLQLVGRNPADQVLALAGPTVEVTGTVPDLTPWYERTRVAVAPLLAGGGSRLKILEALAAARPVVATSIGAEGLEDLIGRGVVVADDPAAMAEELVGLLRDADRAEQLGRDGAVAVAEDHSWHAAVRPLLAELPSNPA